MLISIIIPTKNEEKNIRRCLSSIKESSYRNVEIIIVDQSSTDNTKQIGTEMGAKVIVVPPTNKYVPPSNSRNLGFGQSHGDLIYHLDADMELSTFLLEEIVTIFKDPTIVALVIPETDVPLNLWAKAKAFERKLYYGTILEAARVSKRSVFEKYMYDTTIESGEDWNIHDHFMSAGKIGRTSNTVNHHIGAISLKREFKKKLHYGQKSETYVQKNQTRLLRTFVLLSNLYIVGIVKGMFHEPLTVFAFLVLRLVDILALSMGMISGKLRR